MRGVNRIGPEGKPGGKWDGVTINQVCGGGEIFDSGSETRRLK